MKYIDSEKLIELVKEWRSKQTGFAWAAVNEVLKTITSLQQEQPEVLKSWLEKQFKIAQKCMQQAERDWNRAYENGAMEAYGNTLSFIGRTTPNQENDKEHLEVDLEKEFEDYLDNMEGQPRMWHPDEQIEWAKDIARHFYKLGLNTRKEE